MSLSKPPHYTVITGGVGGAKLVDGLYRLLPKNSLTAIVNTGDDFNHLGLAISPDIDTLLYTLSGKANQQLGWGREGESWNFMATLRSLGGPDWFNLGDGDLALHIMRSSLLAQGKSLSEVTQYFTNQWGLSLRILPMSDDKVATWIDTPEGALSFQSYFVERQCRPVVQSIRFEGSKSAKPAKGALEAIMESEAIFIAPSNPYLSVDPLLAIPEIKAALINTQAPIVAISPIVDGKAVKGPTAKLMGELDIAVSNDSIARHYGAFLNGLVIHQGDVPPNRNLLVSATDTMMHDAQDRQRVARCALDMTASLLK